MFDNKRFGLIIKQNKFTTQTLFEELEHRGVNIGIENLKKYRKGHVANPPFHILDALASILNCTVQDFLTDADEARTKITNQEILSNPQKYSQSLSKVAISSFSPEMKMFINSFMLLSDEEKQHYYEEIADIAARKLTL